MNASYDPDEYVRENRETLVEIIKHSDNSFVRSLCMAALVEYGDDPDIDDVRAEFETIADREGDQ